MQYNLKKFPKPTETIYPKEKHHALIVDMLLWKKGFEEELRKMSPEQYESWGDFGARMRKEILGE